jgi:Domain of unknown function (DUF4384)
MAVKLTEESKEIIRQAIEKSDIFIGMTFQDKCKKIAEYAHTGSHQSVKNLFSGSSQQPSESKCKSIIKALEEMLDTDLKICYEPVVNNAVKYSPLVIDELWKSLNLLSPYSPNKLKVVSPGPKTMGVTFVEPEIIQGSKAYIEIKIEKSGYLILLERDGNKKIACLSPSGFIPEPFMEAGRRQTPQEGSASSHYVFSTKGKTELVAIVFPQEPEFIWLSDMAMRSINARTTINLNEEELMNLLKHIEINDSEIDLFRTHIQVVS